MKEIYNDFQRGLFFVFSKNKYGLEALSKLEKLVPQLFNYAIKKLNTKMKKEDILSERKVAYNQCLNFVFYEVNTAFFCFFCDLFKPYYFLTILLVEEAPSTRGGPNLNNAFW